jgi:hypothetical protein
LRNAEKIKYTRMNVDAYTLNRAEAGSYRKVKLSLSTLLMHTGGGGVSGIAPLMLNRGTRWKGVAALHPVKNRGVH